MKHKGEAASLFSKIPTLSSVEIPALRLAGIFGCDKRYPEAMLQRFIALNRKALDFLGITPTVVQRNCQFTLSLASSNYIGAAPLVSPSNGKLICTINVVGRYNEEIGELLSLISDTLQPEYSQTLRLPERLQKPPIYIECCRYIDTYLQAAKYKWNKFSNEVKIQHAPNSGTQWNKYAQSVASSPLNFLNFQNKCNILSTDHKEWRQLTYVLKLCIEIMEGAQTPIRVKSSYQEKIAYLKRVINEIGSEVVTTFAKRMSDPVVIKQLKEIGNTILDGENNESIAWRLDYSNFFEKYVQYLLSNVVRKAGASIYNNQHFPIRSNHRPKWGLAYLEPDIILQKDNIQYAIDAKYKSHIFNWNEASDTLKDDFRRDFHQVLAYSSFSKAEHKNVALVYPFNAFAVHRMSITSPLNSTGTDILMIGVPISRSMVGDTIEKLGKVFRFD